MRKLYLAIAVTALATMSVPASALSPQECVALQQQIKSLRAVARSGGYTDAAYQSVRAIEEAARDEMVRNGCNKKANANTPLCQSLIARVNEAAANVRNMRPKAQYIQAAGGAELAPLTARYDAECRNQAKVRDQTERNVERLIGLGIGLGIGLANQPGPGRSPQRGPHGR